MVSVIHIIHVDKRCIVILRIQRMRVSETVVIHRNLGSIRVKAEIEVVVAVHWHGHVMVTHSEVRNGSGSNRVNRVEAIIEDLLFLERGLFTGASSGF